MIASLVSFATLGTTRKILSLPESSIASVANLLHVTSARLQRTGAYSLRGTYRSGKFIRTKCSVARHVTSAWGARRREMQGRSMVTRSIADTAICTRAHRAERRSGAKDLTRRICTIITRRGERTRLCAATAENVGIPQKIRTTTFVACAFANIRGQLSLKQRLSFAKPRPTRGSPVNRAEIV